ncbi:DUF7286 family protein [Halorussus litoreus]|uniref:DUF7286 family protein n=1 Tax=Halorussus litoreus TaxID=1710536 RepID=UPI0013007F5B|nr:hypothetical protein [Halorussus litoreus]
MRFAEDRRARVPFALVGVVLLVGSAGLSATLAGGPTPRTDESVGVAVDRTTAATNTALREAVARAGREAARAPVTEIVNASGANGTSASANASRVLNDSTPYRDYLRIRIYLAARKALDSVEVRVRDVRGSASLPATANATALRAAKRRVEIESAGNATNAGLRVGIENVTVAATRDGRTVTYEAVSPTLTVATPALALHERVERFESRLNRGPLVPGLGRRLTGRLYAVAWARGYAQYGGAPIENVVANRHVALATNGAILREQRSAFGGSDPASRRAVRWATARVGATDLLSAADVHYGSEWSKQLLAAADRYREENPLPGGVSADERTGERERTLQIGVNRTADRAFADLVTGENGTGLGEILRSGYAVDARIVTEVRTVEADARPEPSPPSANWSLAGTEVRTTIRVADATGGPPSTPIGWHLLASETRRVIQTHRLIANWTRGREVGNGTRQARRTVQRWSETFEVHLGLAGDHGASGAVKVAPSRPVAGVHERGGALGGANLEGVPDRATGTLVADRGGFDALAERAVAGTLDTRSREIAGRRPADLRPWVYRDVASLRERVRNVSVTVAASETLGGSSAAGELAAELRDRKRALLDAPQRYDGVADRVRVAARATYLDRVIARLDARADRTKATREGIDGALAEAGASLDRVRRILRERTVPDVPPSRPLPADGPGRATNLSVTGAPPYLTLAALDHEQVAAIPESEERHPLAARNRNVFAVPYDDAADAVASAVAGDGESDSVDLRTGALALRAANRTLAEVENRSLARKRGRLRRSLAGSMKQIRRRLVTALGGSRFDLTRAERRTAVQTGLARWNATHARVLAVANGSAARAIADAVVRSRPALRRDDRRDWLELRVELALEAARREVAGAPESLVNRTTTDARKIARQALKDAVSDGLSNATETAGETLLGEALGAVPAGLPVAPVPGYWYATVNVWTVGVEGQYARFAVRAPDGPPNKSVTYVRESGVVRLDWDGDGEREVVGRTAPVAFETETVVAVVVPPGPPGVGDRDGTREEESSGWSSE